MKHVHPLRQYRKDQNITTQKLADDLGVSRPTLWRWETGERMVDRTRLSKIYEKTGILPKALRPDLAEIFEAGS